MIINGESNFPANNCIIGFDAEWTKNYKIKNGNIPFCFSVIIVRREELTINNLITGNTTFNYIQYYCENINEVEELIFKADLLFSKIIKSLDYSILSGHQLSSDINVFLNIAKAYNFKNTNNIDRIRSIWKDRKNNKSIIDTRYDICKPFIGKSRRLVDMCIDFNLDVQQPELANHSMTNLQNEFYKTNEDSIRERISIMNLRHSYSAIVLTILDEKLMNIPHQEKININMTLNKVLKSDFNWVTSPEFVDLL